MILKILHAPFQTLHKIPQRR